jgi:hypothetical protein
VTLSSPKLTLKTNAGTLGYGASSSISAPGTYTRFFRAPVGSTSLCLPKTGISRAQVDNVSVKLASVAYRVAEAPPSE